MPAPVTNAARLLQPIRRRPEAAAFELLHPEGATLLDFTQPPGEPALTAPDLVSWQVFKNPLALFVGGVAAVILELAEPRVRTGVAAMTSDKSLTTKRNVVLLRGRSPPNAALA